MIEIIKAGVTLLSSQQWRTERVARVSHDSPMSATMEECEQFLCSLLRRRHMSVFEFVDYTFEVVMPIHISREWNRHRLLSIMERSTRQHKEHIIHI